MTTMAKFKITIFKILDIVTAISRSIRKKKSFVCTLPFENIHYSPSGMTQCCYSTKEYSYEEFKTGNEFFYSKVMDKLRRSFLKGDYSSCPKTCHVIVNAEKIKRKPWQRIAIGSEIVPKNFTTERDRILSKKIRKVSAVHDDSCNLSCIMCRDNPSSATLSRPTISRVWADINKHLYNIEHVGIGGSGEPLLQKESLDFLFNTTKEIAPNLKGVYVITHGNLLTEQMWNKFSPYIRERIELQVSIDAATKETYSIVRRGGNYEKLLSNLNFIKNLNLNFLIFSMCVQEENFHEMREFIDFCRRYNAKSLFGQVHERDAHAPDQAHHKDHKKILEIAKDDEFLKDDVNANFILSLRDKAL